MMDMSNMKTHTENKITEIDHIYFITNGTLDEMNKIENPNQVGKVVRRDTGEIVSEITPLFMIINQCSKNFREKLFFFNQEMFYYKFNLKLPNHNWVGTRSCKKKHLLSPQWLRNVKVKNYPFYRLDTFFSKTRYTNIKFIDNGGWHFTNIKSAEKIRHKLQSYLHHPEFDINPLTIIEIEDLIKNKRAIYDLTIDKRNKKIGDGNILERYDLNKLPHYINQNLNKFKEWID